MYMYSPYISHTQTSNPATRLTVPAPWLKACYCTVHTPITRYATANPHPATMPVARHLSLVFPPPIAVSIPDRQQAFRFRGVCAGLGVSPLEIPIGALVRQLVRCEVTVLMKTMDSRAVESSILYGVEITDRLMRCPHVGM